MANEKTTVQRVSVAESTNSAHVVGVASSKAKQLAVGSLESSQQPKQTKDFFLGWLIEILSVLAAIISLAAIVAVLVTFDHKEVKQLPFPLELAAILSILVKVTEATIGLVIAACLSQIMWIRYLSHPRPLKDFALYDDATRGPSGQARFLLKRGHSIKGYICVALALLALALGPFVQESVQYEVINGSATLGRCFKSNYTRASDNMYNALHLALYDDISAVGSDRDQILQRLNNNCSTGNCTWPVFASLGVCGKCVDASEKVIYDCTTRQDVLQGSVFGCKASLNNQTFVNNYTDSVDGRILASMGPNINGSSLGSTYGNAISHDFSSLRYGKGNVLHAASCVLYYCVRGYESTVANSHLAENLTLTWSDPNAAKVRGDIITAPQSTQQIGPENDIILTPPQSTWEKLNLTTPTNFTMDWYTHKTLQSIFTKSFNGSTSLRYSNASSPETSQYTTTTGQDLLVKQIYLNLLDLEPTQQNMNTVIDGLGRQMTSALRGTCPTTDLVQGTARNVAEVLKVVWVWLIFPFVVTATTCALLIAVMIDSRRRKGMTWKSTIFPLLFHNLNGAEDGLGRGDGGDVVPGPTVRQRVPTQLATALDGMTGLQDDMRGMRVRLERSQTGTWQLFKHEA